MTNIYPHWKRGSFSIWTDPDRIDLDIVCGFLERWCNGLGQNISARVVIPHDGGV